MAIPYETTKSGFLVDVPPEREAEFHQLFPKAKRKHGKWQVTARYESKLKGWADDAPPAPAQRSDVETDDINAIDSKLEKVGPDLVRRRILERQRDDLLAKRARKSA